MDGTASLDELFVRIRKVASEAGLIASALFVCQQPSDVSTSGPCVEVTVSNLGGTKTVACSRRVFLDYFEQAGAKIFDAFICDVAIPHLLKG